ncbi:hypothetical protein ACQPW1_24715 [Nocardia sp. CA-128927]|uniref:hypothetical protein n=1 Tax=Nocardia sp. CA-128927 TaxID=3239975 RepID=UPI003D99987C
MRSSGDESTHSSDVVRPRVRVNLRKGSVSSDGRHALGLGSARSETSQADSPPPTPVPVASRLTFAPNMATRRNQAGLAIGVTIALLILLIPAGLLLHDRTRAASTNVSNSVPIAISTSAVGIVTATTVVTDPETAGLTGLQSTVASDLPVLTRDVAERWVPQISSKQFGLVAEGITWHHAEILREHRELRARYPNVRLLWSGAWSTFSYPDFWITIVAIGFPSKDGAIRWCADNGLDRDHCYAKLISTSHSVEGSTGYQ